MTDKLSHEGSKLLNQFPEDILRCFLSTILRGRKKTYYVSINGKIVGFRRSFIRDLLLKKFSVNTNNTQGE
jgi:hypothetical protein